MQSTEIMPVQAHTETTGLISMIERVALSPDADIDKLERLLAMQERVMAKQAQMAFDEAQADMQARLPRIVETKNNLQTKSKYAALEDINHQIMPVLQAYGFSVSFSVNQNENNVSVTATLKHRMGHREETTITLPIDNVGIAGTVNKTIVHAIGSTVTYAKRYALCAILNISTGDNDGNNTPHVGVEENAALQEMKKAVMNASEEYKDKFRKTHGSFSKANPALYAQIIKEANDSKEAV